MQDKILRYFVKIISYIIVFIAFYSHAQQDEGIPSFEEEEASAAQIDMSENAPEATDTTVEETGVTINEETLPEPIEGQASEDENANQNEAGAQSGNFDVFRPSEEISEDLAVPFPADI
jgi:hypothetical protein